MKTEPTLSIGDKVEIMVGAWRRDKGIIVSIIPENGAFRVKLDMGMTLAWFDNELKKI